MTGLTVILLVMAIVAIGLRFQCGLSPMQIQPAGVMILGFDILPPIFMAGGTICGNSHFRVTIDTGIHLTKLDILINIRFMLIAMTCLTFHSRTQMFLMTEKDIFKTCPGQTT